MATRRPKGEATTARAAERNTAKAQREAEKPAVESKTRTKKQNKVKVTFQVMVPENTALMNRSVYLAGTLQQVNKDMPDWDAQAQKMKKKNGGSWAITVTCPENAVIEYKYCLGDWEFVEQDEHCRDIPNRRITATDGGGKDAGGEQVIEDRVARWRNVSPCA